MRIVSRLSSLALIASLAGCPKAQPPRAADITPTPPSPSDASAPSGEGGLNPFALGISAIIEITHLAFDPHARVENTGDAWDWHAVPQRGSDAGTSFEHRCPPNGTLSSRVWGSHIYTDDSSICTAAVHAGLITRADGGVVRVYLHPGRNGYVGSGDHDVLSRSFGWFAGSFAFTPTVPEDVFPPPARDGGAGPAIDGAIDASTARDPRNRAR